MILQDLWVLLLFSSLSSIILESILESHWSWNLISSWAIVGDNILRDRRRQHPLRQGRLIDIQERVDLFRRNVVLFTWKGHFIYAVFRRYHRHNQCFVIIIVTISFSSWTTRGRLDVVIMLISYQHYSRPRPEGGPQNSVWRNSVETSTLYLGCLRYPTKHTYDVLFRGIFFFSSFFGRQTSHSLRKSVDLGSLRVPQVFVKALLIASSTSTLATSSRYYQYYHYY